jgi:signal transduction histidine kinase
MAPIRSIVLVRHITPSQQHVMNSGIAFQTDDPSSARVLAVLRQIADATDTAGLAAALHKAATSLFPNARIDLFVVADSAEHLLITCGEHDLPPPPAFHRVMSFVAWLNQHDYKTRIVPVTVARQSQGQLIVSRSHEEISQDILAIAEQIAPVVGLWLIARRHQVAPEQHEMQLLTTTERLRPIEEMQLRATLAAGAAHDIGNLFASVLGHAQLLQQAAPLELQNDLKTIEQAARDGHHLLRRLLSARNASCMPETTMAPVLLTELVHDALRLTQPWWGARHSVTVKIALTPVPPVRGHPADLREVLVNLILNGVAAMPEGGTLTVRTYSVNERAIVEISDTGVGIAPAHQNAIFQPFVTTRKGGSGLGLSVSRTIIERYGGTISVSSTPGRGATFSISLPGVRSADVLPEPPMLQRTAS